MFPVNCCFLRFRWADTSVRPYNAVPVISTVWEISLNVAVKGNSHKVLDDINREAGLISKKVWVNF